MDFDLNTLRQAVTVVSFLVYAGIVAWAWSSSREEDFKQAAVLPFDAD
jgi:cytochrome c oxidase cbb3-type subunit IV